MTCSLPYHVPCPPSLGDELKEKQAAAREASKEAREVARENQAVLRQVAAAEASIAEAERDVQQVRGEGCAVMCCDMASARPCVWHVCLSCVLYSWQQPYLWVNVRGREGLCIVAHNPCWSNNPAMSGCQYCLACGADSRPHKHVWLPLWVSTSMHSAQSQQTASGHNWPHWMIQTCSLTPDTSTRRNPCCYPPPPQHIHTPAMSLLTLYSVFRK